MPIYMHGEQAHKYVADKKRQEQLVKELHIREKACEKDYPASPGARLSDGQLHTMRVTTLVSALLSWAGASFIIGANVFLATFVLAD
jgi:hypothetical protein